MNNDIKHKYKTVLIDFFILIIDIFNFIFQLQLIMHLLFATLYDDDDDDGDTYDMPMSVKKICNRCSSYTQCRKMSLYFLCCFLCC